MRVSTNNANNNATVNPDVIVDQFIKSCSHDLRSPVSTIKGLVKLAAHYPQQEEVHNCLDLIETCTNTMDKLLRSLEEYMYINKYELNPQPVDCSKTVDDVLDVFMTNIESNGVVVDTDSVTREAVLTDPIIFSLICNHLISNAVAYQDLTKKKRRIRIAIKPISHAVEIKIVDNGIGVPEKVKDKIFWPFVKATSLSTRGIGMGLFLFQNMINKVNGQFTFHSRENYGTTVTALIPKLQTI